MVCQLLSKKTTIFISQSGETAGMSGFGYANEMGTLKFDSDKRARIDFHEANHTMLPQVQKLP